MKKCLVIGAAMLDIIMQIDNLPKTGDDVYAKSQEMTVGGCAYNVSDILKHFKVPYTLFAPIGTGMYADFISNRLKKMGHVSPIKSTKMDNGYCLCMVDKNGERTFLTLPGIECQFESKWFSKLNIEDYDSVYICGYEIEGLGGENIIKFLEANKQLQVYYAPGPRITYISAEKHMRINNLHPVIHLNQGEALSITKKENIQEAAETLGNLTKNTVIITLGSQGSYIKEFNKNPILIPAYKTTVVDTIGAGDSHIGTVISMRQNGYSFTEAVDTANKVSSLVVGTQGPTLTDEQFKKGDL